MSDGVMDNIIVVNMCSYALLLSIVPIGFTIIVIFCVFRNISM